MYIKQVLLQSVLAVSNTSGMTTGLLFRAFRFAICHEQDPQAETAKSIMLKPSRLSSWHEWD